MEWILHHIYVVAIKDSRAWHNDTPLEISMIGYWNLIVVWLKVPASLAANAASCALAILSTLVTSG